MQVRPLKGYGSFDKVIRRGHKVFHRGIVAFVHLIPEAERGSATSGIVRLGVTCKKRTRPAVMRNRIKRLLRQSVHDLCTEQPQPDFWQGWPVQEIVLVWTAIPGRPKLLRAAEVRQAVAAVLSKAANNYQYAGERRRKFARRTIADSQGADSSGPQDGDAPASSGEHEA